MEVSRHSADSSLLSDVVATKGNEMYVNHLSGKSLYMGQGEQYGPWTSCIK
jgi:hypothetical protein